MAFDSPNIPERSPLWGMAAAGSLGAGVAYGMHGRWGALKRAATGPSTTSLDLLRQVGPANRFSTGPLSSVETFGDLAVPTESHSMWKSRVADLTYESMMGARTPAGHAKSSAAMARIIEAGAIEGIGLESVYTKALAEIQAVGGDTARFTKAVNSINNLDAISSARFGNVGAPLQGKAGINEIISQNSLSNVERAEFEKITGRLKSKDIFGNLVGEASFRRIGSGSDAVVMAKIGVKGVGDVNLPLSNKGIAYGGTNYTTKYITRGAWDIGDIAGTRGLITKSYTEHYLDTLSSSMTNSFGIKRTARAALHETNLRVAQSMMDEADAAAGKAAIFAEDMTTAGGAIRQTMARNQLVFGGKKLTPALLEEAISLSAQSGTPLTPFAGAGAVGKGALLKGDWRKEAYGGLGELFPAQKQPFQFLRGDFGLSSEAVSMANQPAFRFGGPGAKDTYFNKYISRLSDYKGYKRANLLTVYSLNKKSVSGIMADEMGYMSKSVSDLQRNERLKTVTIRAAENMPGHPAIINKLNSNMAFGEKINFESPIAVTDPRSIGIDVKTNKAYSTGGQGLNQEMLGFKRLDEGRIKVYLRETVSPTNAPRKYFGQGDIKHMIQDVPQSQLEAQLNSSGFKGQKVLGKVKPELHVTASRFMGGKNPAALAQQQLSAMQILTAVNADRTGTMSAEAKAFMINPTEFLESTVFSNNKIKTMAGLQEEVQKAIIMKAQSLGINKGSQFGYVFGAIDRDALKSLYQSGVVTTGQAKSVLRATEVLGMSAPSLGDLAFEGGSGRMGTMDVSGFRVLAEKAYTDAGDVGVQVARDIQSRTITPGAFDEIAKMHGSVIGADTDILGKIKSIAAGEEVTDLAGFKGSLISEEGRWFSTGKEGKAAGIAEKIYIPGTNTAEQLLPSINTTTGETLASQVHRDLGSLRYALGTGDAEAIKSAAADLAAATHSQYAQAATSRGKVIGSRVLTGQQMTAAEQEVMGDVVGISKRTGLEMIDEMITRAPADRQAFLESQRAAFEAGEAITGVGWRHPNVGPESVQFLRMQAMEGAQDAMAYMPQKMGEVILNGTSSQKDLSSMVGWKGDFDKDQFVLSSIAEERAEQSARRALNNSVNTSYNQYLGRHYAMEEMINRHGATAESPVRGISALRQEARAHGYVKMATGETNIALQKAKVAIAANMPERYDELATAMWHLEETAAIGSKHGTLGGGDLYKQISSAINTQDQNKLANVFETVFGAGEQTINATVGGENIAVTMNPQRYAEDIISAIRQSPEEIFASVNLSQAAKGTSSASITAMQEQFAMLQSGRIRDVAGAFAGGEPSFIGNIEGAFAKARTRVRAVTQVLGKNKKPLLIGAAVAGAFAMAAPSLSGALKANPNKMGAGGGRNINPEDSAPPSGLEMNPPKKAIIRSPRAYEMTSRVRGNYNATDMDRDNESIMRQIAAARAGGGNARMHIQDDRSMLDSRMLANKIHERM